MVGIFGFGHGALRGWRNWLLATDIDTNSIIGAVWLADFGWFSCE